MNRIRICGLHVAALWMAVPSGEVSQTDSRTEITLNTSPAPDALKGDSPIREGQIPHG
jgi:hypothetical protein